MAVSGGATEDVMEEAGLLQERAIAAGTHFMAVFPVTYMPALAEQGGAGAALLLSDILELDYWRQPPVFLAVADPGGGGSRLRGARRDLGDGSDRAERTPAGEDSGDQQGRYRQVHP